MSIERRQLIYQGRVQGVGFRMTARRLAAGFPVSGHVRNRPDGTVELVVQGEPEGVAGYVDAVRRAFGDRIFDVREDPLPVDGGPSSGFTILH